MNAANREKLKATLDEVMGWNAEQIKTQCGPFELLLIPYAFATTKAIISSPLSLLVEPIELMDTTVMTGLLTGFMSGWIFAQRGGELYDA